MYGVSQFISANAVPAGTSLLELEKWNGKKTADFQETWEDTILRKFQSSGNSDLQNFSLFQAWKNSLFTRLRDEQSSDWQVSFVVSYWPPREKMKFYFTSTF